MKNIYIIKNITPWMMDELIAFSSEVEYAIILLRKPGEFYDEGIALLKSNKIKIYERPFTLKGIFRKSIIALKFLFINLTKFGFNYNLVVGFRSIFWFSILDVSLFSKESNIHAQFATQASLVSLLIKKYYNNEPYFSFTFHAYDIFFKNNWFSLLVNSCHRAFSISNFNIDYVHNKYGFSDNVVLSRLGVFREINKKENKNNSEVFTLGLMSWFVEKKGIDYLLSAFKRLKEEGFNNIKLVLAGDGPFKEKYLTFIKENNLSETVEYIGKINSLEKDKFYNSLDTFILPSIKLENDQDGIPVVLMEAIAYSLPIISTNVSGIPEICINNYNGKLIEEREVKAIYESILELYRSKAKRFEYANNSYLLSKEYDIVLNSRNKLLNLNWI